jgi:branched-chain amino acid transport system substrate-binding protein
MSDQTAQTDSTAGGPGGYGGMESPRDRGVLGGSSPRLAESAGVSRRGLLRAAGASAAVVGGGGLLEACSSSIKGASSSTSASAGASGSAKEIVIGFIHPLTGALADFGTSDQWIVTKILATSQFKNGFKIGGKTYPVSIKSYDTQSDPNRAGDLASQAILSDKVDMIVTSSTPETVNPVATKAEALGTPTVCGNVPWQAWYANLGGNPTPGTSASTTCAMPSSPCGTGSTRS